MERAKALINTYDQPGVESGKLILKDKIKAIK
jgi:glucose-6-phosphate isomerase